MELFDGVGGAGSRPRTEPRPCNANLGFAKTLMAGMDIEHLETQGKLTSILSGPLADQSALSGVINTLVDLQC